MASERTLRSDLHRSDKIEAKRLELLERNDWQQFRPRKRPRYTFPRFDDKQLVGRRRKLTSEDLERHTVRRKPVLRTVGQGIVDPSYQNLHREFSSNLGDVSIRLGSHIHGSQRTGTQQESAEEAVVVQHRRFLHDATRRPAEERCLKADARESEREKIDSVDEDREMLDTITSPVLTPIFGSATATQSDMNISPHQVFVYRKLYGGCTPFSLDAEMADRGSTSLHDTQLRTCLATKRSLMAKGEADCDMPDALFRSSPPPFFYSENLDRAQTGETGARSTSNESLQVDSRGQSEIGVESSDNRLWRHFLSIPTSTAAAPTTSTHPQIHQDKGHDQSLVQVLTQRKVCDRLDKIIETEEQITRTGAPSIQSTIRACSEIRDTKNFQSAFMAEPPNTSSPAAKEEVSTYSITSADNETWLKFISGDSNASMEVHHEDEEVEVSAEETSEQRSPSTGITEMHHNEDEASSFPCSVAVEPARTLGDSAVTNPNSSLSDDNTSYKFSELVVSHPGSSSMLVEPSQQPEAPLMIESSISSSLIAQASRRYFDSDPATLFPPTLDSSESATHRHFQRSKILFSRPASFIGRSVQVINGHASSNSSSSSSVKSCPKISPLLTFASTQGEQY